MSSNNLEALRSYWELPAVAHFCSLFRSVFKLVDFDIEDLEDALIIDTECSAEGGRSSLIVDILLALLRGQVGKRGVTLLNYNQRLYELLHARWYLAGLGENPLGNDKDKASFHKLPLYAKLKLLHFLCEWRLDKQDVEALTKDFSGEHLRVLPLGKNDKGLIYWYFYGTRLYCEEPEPQEKPTQASLQKVEDVGEDEKEDNDDDNEEDEEEEAEDKASSTTGDDSVVKKEIKDEIVNDEPAKPLEEASTSQPAWDQPLLLPPEETRWRLACFTFDDWKQLAEDYANRSSRREKELHRILTKDFLPAIESLFVEIEKERAKKLAELAPRRSSGRIELKKLKKEHDDKELAMREAVELERLAKMGEEKQRKYMTERREQRAKLRELEREKRLLLRNKARDERTQRLEMRKRRQQLVAEGKEVPEELLTATNGMMTDNEIDELDREIEMEHMYGQLEKIIDALKVGPDAAPFVEPVSEEVAPDYASVIQNPMDLETLEDKLLDRKYNSKKEFIDDFNLILLNCLQYNGIYSEYVKVATRLERSFIRAYKKFFPPTDMQDFSERARQEELECIGLLGALDRKIKETVMAKIMAESEEREAKKRAEAEEREQKKRAEVEMRRSQYQQRTRYVAAPADSNYFRTDHTSPATAAKTVNRTPVQNLRIEATDTPLPIVYKEIRDDGGQVYSLNSKTDNVTRFCKFVDLTGKAAPMDLIRRALPPLREQVKSFPPKTVTTVMLTEDPINPARLKIYKVVDPKSQPDKGPETSYNSHSYSTPGPSRPAPTPQNPDSKPGTSFTLLNKTVQWPSQDRPHLASFSSGTPPPMKRQRLESPSPSKLLGNENKSFEPRIQENLARFNAPATSTIPKQSIGSHPGSIALTFANFQAGNASGFSGLSAATDAPTLRPVCSVAPLLKHIKPNTPATSTVLPCSTIVARQLSYTQPQNQNNRPPQLPSQQQHPQKLNQQQQQQQRLPQPQQQQQQQRIVTVPSSSTILLGNGQQLVMNASGQLMFNQQQQPTGGVSSTNPTVAGNSTLRVVSSSSNPPQAQPQSIILRTSTGLHPVQVIQVLPQQIVLNRASVVKISRPGGVSIAPGGGTVVASPQTQPALVVQSSNTAAGNLSNVSVTPGMQVSVSNSTNILPRAAN